MTTPETVTGWRAWRLHLDGDTPALGAPVLKGDVWTNAGPQSATCPKSPHAVPAEGCTCGYRVLSSLAEMCTYLARVKVGLEVYHSLGETDAAAANLTVALVKVRGSGRILPGIDEDPHYDPPSTWRVSDMRIVGPILLAPDASLPPTVANGYRETFGVETVTADPELTMLDWLADLAGPAGPGLLAQVPEWVEASRRAVEFTRRARRGRGVHGFRAAVLGAIEESRARAAAGQATR